MALNSQQCKSHIYGWLFLTESWLTRQAVSLLEDLVLEKQPLIKILRCFEVKFSGIVNTTARRGIVLFKQARSETKWLTSLKTKFGQVGNKLFQQNFSLWQNSGSQNGRQKWKLPLTTLKCEMDLKRSNSSPTELCRKRKLLWCILLK